MVATLYFLGAQRTRTPPTKVDKSGINIIGQTQATVNRVKMQIQVQPATAKGLQGRSTLSKTDLQVSHLSLKLLSLFLTIFSCPVAKHITIICLVSFGQNMIFVGILNEVLA